MPEITNDPLLPVIVPRLVRPLPQLIVAMKLLAEVALFTSVNVAIGPAKSLLLTTTIDKAWPVRLSG